MATPRGERDGRPQRATPSSGPARRPGHLARTEVGAGRGCRRLPGAHRLQQTPYGAKGPGDIPPGYAETRRRLLLARTVKCTAASRGSRSAPRGSRGLSGPAACAGRARRTRPIPGGQQTVSPTEPADTPAGGRVQLAGDGDNSELRSWAAVRAIVTAVGGGPGPWPSPARGGLLRVRRPAATGGPARVEVACRRRGVAPRPSRPGLLEMLLWRRWQRAGGLAAIVCGAARRATC